MARKRRGHGHYCWCCGRMRPNEKFSGSGHARHLCVDCSRLDASELRYQQDLINLERLVTWEGIIRRKSRKAFNRFLEHPDPRLRDYAEKLAVEDAEARALLRFSDGNEDRGAEAAEANSEDPCGPEGTHNPGDDGIPF